MLFLLGFLSNNKYQGFRFFFTIVTYRYWSSDCTITIRHNIAADRHQNGPLREQYCQQLTNIGRGWAGYRDLSVRADQLFAEAESRYFATIIIIIVLSFDHQVFFLMNILRKLSDVPFLRKSDRKKEKSVVSFTHELNIICIQTLKPLCHVVGSRPMKGKKKCFQWLWFGLRPTNYERGPWFTNH